MNVQQGTIIQDRFNRAVFVQYVRLRRGTLPTLPALKYTPDNPIKSVFRASETFESHFRSHFSTDWIAAHPHTISRTAVSTGAVA